MKAFVDAGLPVYLNAVAEPGARASYEDFFLDLVRRYKLYTDPLVLDELLYVSKRRFRIPYRVSVEFIRSIVLPYVAVASLGESELESALEELLEHGLRPSDALHLGVMKSNGISVIVSEDKEFDRVQWLRREWLSSRASRNQ